MKASTIANKFFGSAVDRSMCGNPFLRREAVGLFLPRGRPYFTLADDCRTFGMDGSRAGWTGQFFHAYVHSSHQTRSLEMFRYRPSVSDASE
ncbi:MAG: hypothetical protein DCC68_23155 [Planctomycetota bacterium]|nr:MAG: hypothetical protein DCC68_23155 [Planctomycetota bacterium]